MSWAGGVENFEAWRALARERLVAGVRPEDVVWSDARNPSMFGQAMAVQTRGQVVDVAPAIPRELLDLLQLLACYRDSGRWDLMYRLTWRVVKENRQLLQNHADSEVRKARTWSKAVSQDVHKMHAFVRFHETTAEDGAVCYVAWFEPSHEILRYVAPFFEQRFGNMRWMIATPDGAVVWNGVCSDFIDSPGPAAVPRKDATHDLWRAYYRNICNVARVNPRTMQREMPQRYWRHLPEAPEIHTFLQHNHQALHETLRTNPVMEDVRVPRGVASALDRITAVPMESPLSCQRCGLWRNATQAVLGEGPKDARVMLVGEQPGDEEDLRGRPFVGPAGRVLDNALEEAGLSRAELFVTNAVKHFKWEPRGKRRLHLKPQQQEISACRGWLEREIAAVEPRVIVAMGATAIRAVTGLSMTIEAARSAELCLPGGAKVIATYHPSAVLRAPDERRNELFRALVEDLSQTKPMARPAMLTANHNASDKPTLTRVNHGGAGAPVLIQRKSDA
jgi:uracil-DNA glycosylase